MEAEESSRVVPFHLQLDKPLTSQVKIAAWNPEKDLFAMVTEDSKLHLHRFNWQRLWTASPAKKITSICWRPDGKVIALGLEDGTISLHDVENGKLLKSMKFHKVAVVCLNWEEDRKQPLDADHLRPIYEDRTARFFPSAPQAPRNPGLVPVDASGFADENDCSFWELFNASQGHFDILCSGDVDGNVHFNIFGIFPIGRLNIRSHRCRNSLTGEFSYRVKDASICKVALSVDLCHMLVLCSGVLAEDGSAQLHNQMPRSDINGFHNIVLNCRIFHERKNELHQVALQAANVEHLIEVIRRSIGVMAKQWSDAMNVYHEKFNPLSSLIIDHGLDSSPEEEFLSLLGGARTSPPIHQFLVNSLGEAGIKRVAKVVCGAGKELQTIALDHLQPAAEIIAFRLGELRGLSKWQARFRGIGLVENLMDTATEEAGMLLIQIERFTRILSSVVQQFSNFFNWLIMCVKLLMSEPSDQLLPFSSEIVILFLKFLYNQDPIGILLQDPGPGAGPYIEVDLETRQRVDELTHFGGFPDSGYLERTLAKEFHRLECCFSKAMEMPLATVSRNIICQDILPLFSLSTSLDLKPPCPLASSISYFQETSGTQQKLTDYTSFVTPDGTFLDVKSCICVVRGLVYDLENLKSGNASLEFALLCAPDGYRCVDLSLYKEEQIVLLLSEVNITNESSGNSCMMILRAADFTFTPITRISIINPWNLFEIQGSAVHLVLENEKIRNIPHTVVRPIAVSASRGVGCVFTARKRALVYILDEDEDEASGSE